MSATILLTVMLAVSGWNLPGTIVHLQDATPTPVPTEDSWVIVDLPSDATQLEYGTEVYRLVCKACHGDRGQGLTDDWRAQWAPEDQNCWQSKCHALNHPPDGFYMPIAPPVLGVPLLMFDTALDLFEYNRDFMPWHDRGSMTEKEYWSVTAYLLKINGVDPGPELGAETAAGIPLRGKQATAPAVTAVATAHAVPEGPTESLGTGSVWIAFLILVIAVALVVLIVLARRSET